MPWPTEASLATFRQLLQNMLRELSLLENSHYAELGTRRSNVLLHPARKKRLFGRRLRKSGNSSNRHVEMSVSWNIIASISNQLEALNQAR